MNLSERNKTVLWLLCLVVIPGWLLARRVIVDFSGPLMGTGDVDVAEHIGYLFWKSLSFNPLPHLAFDTDLVFYPHRISSILQAWFLEREYLYTLGNVFYGPGPWLKWHAQLSFLAVGLGTFGLLRRDYGTNRAGLAGFAVSTLNFYAIHKYPNHFNIALCHWTVLNLVSDFVCYRQLRLEGFVDLRRLLLRALLLVLALGQDLSYNAGIALMSFLVTLAFSAVFVFRRNAKAETFAIWKAEFRAHRATCGALIAAILVFAYLFVPICIQVFLESKRYPGIKAGTYWPHTLRWLMPWIPSLHSTLEPLQKFFRDSPEGIGAASPGWTLLIPALIGLWAVRVKKLRFYTPVLVVLALCLLYHPTRFPVLKIFPWFSHLRVAGRLTVVFPAILALLALEAKWPLVSRRGRAAVGAGFALIALVEIYTAYWAVPFQPSTAYDPALRALTATVRNTPGEAVLDWPFCVASGNGAAEELCPYYGFSETTHALQRFHDKKTFGLYFGRLTREMVRPHLRDGWKFLLAPNEARTAQSRCFSEAEWSFFTRYFAHYDFAGLNLYPDRLAPGCEEEFYRRFGQASAQAHHAAAGRVAFIPKPPSLHSEIPPPPYQPDVKTDRVDVFNEPAVDLEGFARGLRRDGRHSLSARKKEVEGWISFPTARRVRVTLQMEAAILDQRVTIAWNAKTVYEGNLTTTPAVNPIVFEANAEVGVNHFEMKFAKTGSWGEMFDKYRTIHAGIGGWNVFLADAFYWKNGREPAYLTGFVIEAIPK